MAIINQSTCRWLSCITGVVCFILYCPYIFVEYNTPFLRIGQKESDLSDESSVEGDEEEGDSSEKSSQSGEVFTHCHCHFGRSKLIS